MASATFNTLQTLHILGAMVVVGYVAVIPMWRAAMRKDAEPSVLRGFLSTVHALQTRVVFPALGVILVTGILMTVPPLAEGYDLARWRAGQAGLVVTFVLGFVVWNGLGAPSKKMLAFVDKGEHTGPAMDKLWSDWRVALLAAAVLSIAATVAMVFGANQ